jgi:DNA-binding NarL/FixJ family response regulator
VASGAEYRSPSIVPTTVSPKLEPVATERPPGRPLSPREREVLQLIAAGRSSKEIAASLEIGLATVETHRRQLMDKLGLRTIAELTKYAIKAGLASLE